MFNKGEISDAQKLDLDRQVYGLSAVLGVLYTLLFVKTMCGAKLPFILVISGLSVLSFAFGIMAVFFENWALFGSSEKGIPKKAQDSFWTAMNVSSSLGCALYYQTHWIFSWRYWKVATLVSSVKNGKTRASCEWINYAMHVTIMVNFIVYAVTNNRKQTVVQQIFWLWVPLLFILADCLLLMSSLILIWQNFKDERTLMINERFMILHFTLLSVLAIS